MTAFRGRAFTGRYLYARSAETRACGDRGQDYLVFREHGNSLTFALCDGVTQSFFGDMASRFLGNALQLWLESLTGPLGEAELRQTLREYLLRSTGPATELVAAQPLPAGLSPLVRDVLEQKRRLGSETTFACGRVDLPGTAHPKGRLLLAWMGDSRLRAWGAHGERSADLTGAFATAQRWSTRRGPVGGEPNVHLAPLAGITRLAAYTDGIARLDQYELPPADGVLGGLVRQLGMEPTSDDIAFLEVQPRRRTWFSWFR